MAHQTHHHHHHDSRTLTSIFLTATIGPLPDGPSRVYQALASAGPALGAAGILLNHARRVLLPAAYPASRGAMEDMKLARSATAWYLAEETLGGDGGGGGGDVGEWLWLEGGLLGEGLSWVVMLAAWMGVWEGVRREGSMTVSRMEAGGGSMCVDEVKRDVWLLINVVMSLGWIEYVYETTCWTLAHIYAFSSLLIPISSSPTNRAFLSALVQRHALPSAVHCLILAFFLLRQLLPEARRALGQPARAVLHGSVWYVTVYLVRHSNRYFMLLQMAGMVVTMGWMMVGGGIWAWEVMRARKMKRQKSLKK